ncbi:BQ2448_5396 [Microbotryum intermedium]|uniref:BQ2448_5396 protein n=1 Tax=Microbotryum intermedium TaxID=269621 RepID=A0A238F434_9BASI|nr:BQ2448_5396 [Microbotryum intermedium]
MAQVPPPLGLTYIPPAAPLPSWMRYTSSPIATSTLYYTVNTLQDGTPTVQSGSIVVTNYLTQIIQLPLTVDVPYSVGAPYTNDGGTGPTVVSILGATGSGATFVLAASVISTSTPTAAPFPTAAAAVPFPTAVAAAPSPTTAAPEATPTAAQPNSAPTPTAEATPTTSSLNDIPTSPTSIPSADNGAATVAASGSNLVPPSTSPNPESLSSLATPQSAATSITSTGNVPPVAMLTYMTNSDGVAMLTFVTDGTSDGFFTTASSTSANGDITGPVTALPRSLSSRFSGGEIAGIVIGCLICAFLLFVIFVLCFIRRRRAKRRRQQIVDTRSGGFAQSRQVPSEVSPVLSGRQNSAATTGESGSRSERFLGMLGIRRGSSRSQEGTAAYSGDGNESFGGGRSSGSHSIGSREEVGAMMREVTMGEPAPKTPRRCERGTLLSAFREHLDTSSNEYEPEYHDRFGAQQDGCQEYLQRGFGSHHQRSMSEALVATSMLKGLEDDWQPNSPMTPLLVRDSHPTSSGVGTPPRDNGQVSPMAGARKPPKRRPVSEMGWLSGRGSIDPSTASSRESSVPTFGSRNSGGGSSGRSNKASKPFDVPLPRSASVGNISRGGSRGVSLDHSPNLNEFFYTTQLDMPAPRWTGGPSHTVMRTPPRRMVIDEDDRKSPYRSPYRDIPFIMPSQEERQPSTTPAASGGAGSALLGRIATGWGSTLSSLGLAPAPSISARQRERSQTSSAGDHSLMDPFASHGMISPSASAPLILDHQSSPSRSLRRGLRGPREPSNRSMIQGRRSLTFGQPIQVPPISMAGSISDFNHTAENERVRPDSENENGIFADAVEPGENGDDDDDDDDDSNHEVSIGGSSIYGGLRSGTPLDTEAEDDIAPRPYRASQWNSTPRPWNTVPDIRAFKSVTSESLITPGANPSDGTSQERDEWETHSGSEFGLQPYPTLTHGTELDSFISHGHRGSTSTFRTLGPVRSPSIDSGQGSSPTTLHAKPSPQTGQTRFLGADELSKRNTLGRVYEVESLMVGRAL